MVKNHIIYEPFSDWRFRITKAQESYIWDDRGNRLIDFTSGWNVANLGWNHPALRKAAVDQLKKNAYAPMWTSDPIQEAYATALVKALPKELCAIGRATGGTEANSEAVKVAKAYTGRKKILGFTKTYHGQSTSMLALGGFSMEERKKEDLHKQYVQIEFPSMYDQKKNERELLSEFSERLEAVLSHSDIAAIVTEAGIITGYGSTRIAPHGFLSIVRKLTKKYGTLMILDEVGTGFSRCGELFGMNLENVVPDIVTFAKGATNGAAVLGTMVTTKKIAEETIDKANLISTFGWTPLSCAVALRTLELHQELKLWEKSAEDGAYFVERLKTELKDDSRVTYIAGKGLLVGVHFTNPSNKPLVIDVVAKAQKNGLHIVCDRDSTIQLMPPLTTSKAVLDKGIDILVSTVKSIK